MMLSYTVVPLVGTWIEIKMKTCYVYLLWVVPLVGTWIEIPILISCPR